jgi:putative glutamine amidotransferase
MPAHPPIVGFPCDYRMIGKHPFHMVGDKYIAAVRESTGAVTLLIPVLANPISPAEILATVDGLLFTGSPSNVAPRHYGGTGPRDGVLQDENRDATALPLLKAAIAGGTPVLSLCRGFQELNVALGGTLHQHVHELPPSMRTLWRRTERSKRSPCPARRDLCLGSSGIPSGAGPRAR